MTTVVGLLSVTRAKCLQTSKPLHVLVCMTGGIPKNSWNCTAWLPKCIWENDFSNVMSVQKPLPGGLDIFCHTPKVCNRSLDIQSLSKLPSQSNHQKFSFSSPNDCLQTDPSKPIVTWVWGSGMASSVSFLLSKVVHFNRSTCVR